MKQPIPQHLHKELLAISKGEQVVMSSELKNYAKSEQAIHFFETACINLQQFCDIEIHPQRLQSILHNQKIMLDILLSSTNSKHVINNIAEHVVMHYQFA